MKAGTGKTCEENQALYLHRYTQVLQNMWREPSPVLVQTQVLETENQALYLYKKQVPKTENQALYLYKRRYWREGIKPCTCTKAGTGGRESSPVLVQTQVLEGLNQALYLYKRRYWRERIKPCTCTKGWYRKQRIKPCTCTNAGTGRRESSPVLVQTQVLEGENQALYLYKRRYWKERIKPCTCTNAGTGGTCKKRSSGPVSSKTVAKVTEAGTCVAVR